MRLLTNSRASSSCRSAPFRFPAAAILRASFTSDTKCGCSTLSSRRSDSSCSARRLTTARMAGVSNGDVGGGLAQAGPGPGATPDRSLAPAAPLADGCHRAPDTTLEADGRRCGVAGEMATTPANACVGAITCTYGGGGEHGAGATGWSHDATCDPPSPARACVEGTPAAASVAGSSALPPDRAVKTWYPPSAAMATLTHGMHKRIQKRYMVATWEWAEWHKHAPRWAI